MYDWVLGPLGSTMQYMFRNMCWASEARVLVPAGAQLFRIYSCLQRSATEEPPWATSTTNKQRGF